ncbi:SIMPL domain-containing protein [Hydrogenophaga palleronii]|uniref:SIMPL domain-containing protein n=1 Tax=Hydrogenophaga palleronii TaxID=65655 RepID=UPI0008251123
MTLSTLNLSARSSFVPTRLLLPALLAFGLGASTAAMAQNSAPVPANVVNISASGFLEVPQDWLSMSLNTTREGSDAATVQNQLKQALDAALAIARANAKPQQLEVRTGQFSLYPRYTSNGKINGWQGSTELVIEGRDFAAISATAGKIQTLTMSGTSFSLSRDARRKLESDVQAMAIERFKARADEVSKGFGFTAYSLREVSVSSADQESRPHQPRMLAMEAKAAMSDAAVPVEAGKSTVNVTVSGSIQLR